MLDLRRLQRTHVSHLSAMSASSLFKGLYYLEGDVLITTYRRVRLHWTV